MKLGRVDLYFELLEDNIQTCLHALPVPTIAKSRRANSKEEQLPGGELIVAAACFTRCGSVDTRNTISRKRAQGTGWAVLLAQRR